MTAPLLPPRILVVDDNEDAADSLVEVLGLLEHEARAAYGGRQALLVAREFLPRIVLLDLSMPDVDGFETLKLLRAEPGLAPLHVLAMTGHGAAEDIVRCHAAGFDEHLTKPVTIEHLMKVLDRLKAG